MNVKISIENDVNVGRVMQQAVSNKFWTYAAMEWHRLYFDWIPMRVGALARNVSYAPKEITHLVPYAGPQYDGMIKGSPVVNYTRSLHPLATSHWDRAASPTQRPKLEIALSKYLDKLEVNG